MKQIFFTLSFAVLVVFNAGAQAGMQRTAKGALCQIISKNPGEKIKQNDVITFQAIQRTDKDSILFSTYAQGQPVKAQVHPSANVGDLMDIFPLMSVNDSAVVKVPIDSIFKGHEEARPPFLQKGGNLVFNIKILKVQSLTDAIAERNAGMEKLRAAEKAGADAYIKSNNLMVKTMPSGLAYVITKAGTKPRPLPGDTVLVNYTGRTLDGKVFDTSIEADARAAGLQQPGRNYEPIKFPLGAQAVIAGWDEGLQLLNEGSKATFIVPSKIGYGDRGNGEAIPPFSTLAFNVELVKVIRAKHPAPVVKPGKKAPLKKRTAAKKKIK